MATLVPVEPLAQTGTAELWVSSEISEEQAAAFYLRLYADGLLPEVFYSGIPSIPEFLSWLKRPDILTVGAFVRSRADAVPGLDEAKTGETAMAGMVFFWDIKGVPGAKRGDIGIVFLRRFQRRSITIPLSRLVMDHAFQRGLDVLYGLSAIEGRAAVALAHALGFEQVGPLPLYGSWNGRPSAAIMTWMTKTRFYELERQREHDQKTGVLA